MHCVLVELVVVARSSCALMSWVVVYGLGGDVGNGLERLILFVPV